MKALGKPLPKLATISNNGKGVCWQERDKFLRTALLELAEAIEYRSDLDWLIWKAKQARISAGQEGD